jgi:crotonobetainyl-CoA:carnitine CoA-transferase CaiB-like acyl-CoA transferase
MTAIGRADLRDDPALARNDGRAAQMQRIDEAIAAWTSQRAQGEVLAAMERAEVPAGTIFSIADIARDPHYAARGMLLDTTASDGEPLKQPGIVPKLSASPGGIRHAAPALGEHNDEILSSIGYSADEVASLRAARII